MKCINLYALVRVNTSECCPSRLLLLLYSNRALCWPWHSGEGWKAIFQIKTVESFLSPEGRLLLLLDEKTLPWRIKPASFFRLCCRHSTTHLALKRAPFKAAGPTQRIRPTFSVGGKIAGVLAAFKRCTFGWWSLAEETIMVLICFPFTVIYPAVRFSKHAPSLQEARGIGNSRRWQTGRHIKEWTAIIKRVSCCIVGFLLMCVCPCFTLHTN